MFYQCHKPSPSTYRTSLATSANPNRTAPCKVTPPSELFVACKYPVKKTRSIYILNPTVIGVMFTITNYILGSGQNLLLSILVGWTPIYQLRWGSLGTRVLTHSLWSTMVYHPHQPSTYGIPLVFTVSPDPQTPRTLRSFRSLRRQGKRRLCFRLFDSNQDGFAEKAGLAMAMARWMASGASGLENYPLGICYITSIYKGFSMAMLNNQRVRI